MFNIDKIYQKYATILSNSTGYYCLKVLYKIINYIDDNLPVIKKRVLTKEK